MANVALWGQPVQVQAHFWKHVPLGCSDDECWLWTGRANHAGYGVLGLSGVPWIASRVMLELKLGRGLRVGEMACHQCDTPGCVNPAHLFVGTAHDNQRDKWVKGRGITPGMKLTPGQARQIWSLRDSSRGAAGRVARQFGVQRIAVWRIWNRITWTHVTGEEQTGSKK